jgi:hypothetical protein
MRISSFGPLLVISAAGLVAAPARADSSARHPAPPANADLAALKDSIAALTAGSLHDLSDSAAKTATRLDAVEGELKRLRARLEGADLAQWGRDQAATKTAVGDLSGKTDALDQQMQELGARLDGAAAKSARSEKELRAALGVGAAQLAALAQDEKEWHEIWPQQWAQQAHAAAAAQTAAAANGQRNDEIAAGGLAAIFLAGLLWQERRRRRRHGEIVRSITSLEAELRQELVAAGAAGAAAARAGWNAIEDRLEQFARRWGENAPALAGGVRDESLPTLRCSNGAAHSGFAPAHRPPNGHSISPSEGTTVSVGLSAEPFIASRLLWPAEFLDPQSPLSRWRFLLESHFDDAEHPALPVLAGLLGLRAATDLSAVSPAEIGTAAFRLSEALHAYWQSLSDLSAEDRQQASTAWISHVRQLIAPAAPRLELREVMPGARVDPDLMHAAQERSGNHLNVAEVHSWAVVDRTGDRPKVIHRAQIAST